MHLIWLALWEAARRPQHDGERIRPCNAFADPLDGPEWQGLGWVIGLMAARSRLHRHVRRSRSGRAVKNGSPEETATLGYAPA